MAADRKLPIGTKATEWLVHIVNERISFSKSIHGFRRFRYTLFRTMLRNSTRADQFFGLGNKVALSVEVVPVKFG
jgi:hypothetical protein